MSEEFFNQSEDSRDGFRSQDEENAKGNGRFESGHTPRPRINRNFRQAGSSEYGNQRGYGMQRQGGEYRPRYNGEGGYQSSRRQDSRDGNYQPRNGYQPRDGYQPRENRWGKSRYGQNAAEGGGYTSRGGQGGYQPRYNREGYEQDGGYQPRGGQNGYQPRRQGGGYQPRGGQGGFRPRYQGQGGYGRQQQRRPGYDPHAKYSHKKRMEYKEENYDPTVPLRLNKFLANAGICSRRDADKYIEAGVVSVNGVVVTELGAKVLRTDEIKFHDNLVKMEKKVYVLLNKPKGYVTTSEDPQNRKTVMDLVQNACPERIYPVGRLDRNTTGVLLLTNDGELASKLTHPKFLKKKIYHVTTDQNVTAADIQQIADGITLDDGQIKADAVEYAHPTDKKQVGIEIHSGKNRIVRRIFESLGYHVTKLDRVYFAGLTKKNVRRGDWRYLTEKEVQMLRMGAFE